VAYLREASLPEAQQSAEFRASRAQIEGALRAPAQVDPLIANELLALWLDVADTWLDADDPLRATLFQPGENSVTAARRIAGATRVLDPAYRQELLAAGAPALESTTDPLLRFALAAAPVYETTNEEWSSLTAEEGVQE